MSERIEKAFKELVDAVNDEAVESVEKIKTVVEPVLTQAVAQITAAFVASKFKFEDFVKAAKEDVEPKAAPLPTEAENKLIVQLRESGKSDEEIAKFLGLNILTVKMAA